MKKKPQVGKPKTKIPIDETKYPDLWFDNQEDLDAFDSLMRKKIYFQANYGEKGDKTFIENGIQTTFGIYSRSFQERIFKNSDLLSKQLDYVRFIYILA